MGLSVALVSSLRWKKRFSSKAMRRGRGKRRRGGDDFVMAEIPWEIQIEILIRLPAESLMRFKCVSKLWFSLIRCRYFTNRYYLTVASTPRLYMSLVDHHGRCGSPCESALLSLSSSSRNKGKSFYPDLAMKGIGGYNMEVFRGLILYVVSRKECIYNPATRQCITLPAVVQSKIFFQKAFSPFRKHVHYFFGHDPVLDQYKVVCSAVSFSKDMEGMTSEYWVFLVQAGGIWKKVEFDQPHFPKSKGLCIDGVVYYLAATSMSRSIVVSFDVGSDEFNTFQVPHSVPAHDKPVGFIEYGGKPAIFDHTNLAPMGLVDLWVLEDGGKWSTKSMVLQPRQMRLFDKNSIPLHVHDTTQNGGGEVILVPYQFLSPYYIFYYHVQKNDLRKVRIGGIPGHWFNKRVKVDTSFRFFFSVMDSESIMHLET